MEVGRDPRMGTTVNTIMKEESLEDGDMDIQEGTGGGAIDIVLMSMKVDSPHADQNLGGLT